MTQREYSQVAPYAARVVPRMIEACRRLGIDAGTTDDPDFTAFDRAIRLAYRREGTIRNAGKLLGVSKDFIKEHCHRIGVDLAPQGRAKGTRVQVSSRVGSGGRRRKPVSRSTGRPGTCTCCKVRPRAPGNYFLCDYCQRHGADPSDEWHRAWDVYHHEHVGGVWL